VKNGQKEAATLELERTWAEISLENLDHNYRQIRACLRPGCRLMGVLKADAYGHGAIAVARRLCALGAECLSVATIDEAAELREADISPPILILGPTPPDRTDELIAFDLTQTLYSDEEAHAFSTAAQALGRTLRAHIKVDTGMCRLGLLYLDPSDPDKTVDEVLTICRMPGLATEGIYTHFAIADVRDDPYTQLQFDRFMELLDRLAALGCRFAVHHCANSSATVHFPHMQLDLVRPGIMMYGAYPSDDMRPVVDLQPVMSLRAIISQVKMLPAGVPVSYGCHYRTTGPTCVAVAEIGYGDGLLRSLSNRGHMLVHGQLVPIIGTICMDRCMLDVTGVGDVRPGDVATVFGTDGAAIAPVERLADAAGTISYELLCRVSRRVPRWYQ